MSIREIEKLTNRQMENIKRKHEREIKNIETIHLKRKDELAKTQAAELVDLRVENHRGLDNENIKKEKILENMRSHLQQTEKFTEKQLTDLKTRSEKEKYNIAIKFAEDRDRINANHELHMAELNHLYQQQNRKVQEDGQSVVNDSTLKLQHRHNEIKDNFQNKINESVGQFTRRFQAENKKQEQLKDESDRQYKKERLQTNQRQQQEMVKMSDEHRSHVQQQHQSFRKGLKEQEGFYEKKYAVSLTNKTDDLKRLDKLHEKVVTDLKKDLNKEMTKTAVRSDDPFYQLSELKPTMEQYPDRVEIKVSVPEYDKQDLQLTINNKEVILTFSRRFNESSRNQDGFQNKVNRVESYTTRLNADHFLDAKSVKHSYQDGTMTYVIKKA